MHCAVNVRSMEISQIWPMQVSVDRNPRLFRFRYRAYGHKAQIMALASGDAWLEKGANLLMFGPPGVGKSHLAFPPPLPRYIRQDLGRRSCWAVPWELPPPAVPSVGCSGNFDPMRSLEWMASMARQSP